MSPLQQRVLTAVILIPLFLLLLFFLPPICFLIFTGALTVSAAWEWSSLMQLKTQRQRFAYSGLFLLCCVGVLFTPTLVVITAGCVWWLISIILLLSYPRMQWWQRSVAIRGVMGFFVLIPCWIAINYIRNQPLGLPALLFLFVLIWGADSAAYFAGKYLGASKNKKRLAPLISPGKTIQGAVAALLFALVLPSCVLGLGHASLSSVSAQLWAHSLGLALITVIFSIIGDLFESMLKRNANLKDSGALLPGHGGLLDRIDSLTAAAPVFVYVAWLLR